ncbi:MAG: hypothetical protein PHC50_09415 [Candidatus Cloacimonetes bacterium]|nr:hypothetical protein [Candidatus Cloacimonadota bacterium]
MKRALLLLVWLFICSSIFAQNIFSEIAENVCFTGDLAVFAQSDTIMYVYSQRGDPYSSLVLRYSFDNGENWQQASISNLPDTYLSSLCPTDNGVYIETAWERYFFDFETQNLHSLDLEYCEGNQIRHFIIHNGKEYSLSNKKAYPESLQYDYAYNDSENPYLPSISLFADQMKSIHDNNVYFYGQDFINGVVGSNSDIYLKQAGGGTNNGWPTFLRPVFTAGNIVSIPPIFPPNIVFRGGLFEETTLLSYPETINIQSFDEYLGGENKITLIEMNGENYSGWEGTFGPERRVSKTVYSSYPPAGDSLYTNSYAVRDTLWTPISGTNAGGKRFWVDGDLWIKGNFAGEQSWCASGDIKLLGEITLTNTIPGSSPHNNYTDFVNLISGGDVILGYGYKSPADSIRYHCFLGSDDELMNIYANIYAIGNPNASNSLSNGVFTFEYQHPHPSTPAIHVNMQHEDGTITNVIYDNIDIHRRHYPPTAENPWPSPALGQTSLDLPYYNPLWPEAQPYLERGVIRVFGNIFERRRGYLHRSHNDAEYPSNSGVWNTEMDMCGYPTQASQIPDPVFGNQLSLIAINYPGAIGSGVGYKKMFVADNRRKAASLPDDIFIELLGLGTRLTRSNIEDDASEEIIYLPNNEATLSLNADKRDGNLLFASTDALFFVDAEGNAKDLSALTKAQGIIYGAEIDIDGNIWILQRTCEGSQHNMYLRQIDPISETVLNTNIFTDFNIMKPAGIHISPEGRKFLALFENWALAIYEIMDDQPAVLRDILYIGGSFMFPYKTNMKLAADGTLHVFYGEII